MLIKSNLQKLNRLNQNIGKYIHISIKSTPNDNFLKFQPKDTIIMQKGSYEFTDAKLSQQSPLAQKLFQVQGVNRVFFGFNFISISKSQDVNWEQIQDTISEEISNHIDQKLPFFNINDTDQSYQKNQNNDSETVQFIKEILESRIKTIVQDDGGDIDFKNFDEETGVVSLIMKGSCAGCPSSGATLKNGVERMLKHYVAEVTSVLAEDFQQ